MASVGIVEVAEDRGARVEVVAVLLTADAGRAVAVAHHHQRRLAMRALHRRQRTEGAAPAVRASVAARASRRPFAAPGLDGELRRWRSAPGRAVIGTQRLYHLRAGSAHEFRAAFRSRECGTHKIYAVAGPGTRFEHHAPVETITVDCGR